MLKETLNHQILSGMFSKLLYFLYLDTILERDFYASQDSDEKSLERKQLETCRIF